MFPQVAFMRILIYGSTRACVCGQVKNGIRILTNTFKDICFRLAGLFCLDGQSRRRDCEVGVASTYDLDGIGFESWQGK
jgi:hypothetical protein